MMKTKGYVADLLYKEEVYLIIGAAMEVYNQLGPGFLEAVYQEALEIELEERKIPFEPQVQINVLYKGRCLKQTYKPDLLAFDKIVIEIKALDQLSSREEAQLLNQLKATKAEMGLLINFGSDNKLEWHRMVLSQK